MNEPQEELAALRRGLWQRRSTRRALLAGSAAVAAAGTAATVVGISRYSGGSDSNKTPATAGSTASATPDPNRPVADPRRRAAHLLRRAGFGGAMAEIEQFAALSREDAADRLLNYDSVDNSALNARIAAASFNLTTPGNQPGIGRLFSDMQRWWLTRMAYTARPLEERMTLIWHGLLTSQLSKIGPQMGKLMVSQNELFRANALGRYDDLLHAIGKDPAMIMYLDTMESTKEHPNENYARELMELFSMGVGNYTEDDVRESARAFTGWRTTPPPRPKVDATNLTQKEKQEIQDKAIAEWEPVFVVAVRQHDYGTKAFLGKTGNFDGDDIVDIIMQQPATGRFITTRLFTEFANYNPDPATIDRLVKVWDSSGHSVRDIVRAILVSDEFYSERSYRGFVRSPVEFVVGAVRALEIETDFRGIERSAKGMDQVLFEPPSVAGWPGGATWLSSSTFFGRVNFLDSFLFGRPRVTVPALANATTPEETVDIALARLVDNNVPDASRDALYTFARGTTRPDDRAAAVAYLVLASPEYQLI